MVIGLVVKIVLIIGSVLGAATATSFIIDPNTGTNLFGNSSSLIPNNSMVTNTSITGNPINDTIAVTLQQKNLTTDLADMMWSGVSGVSIAFGNILNVPLSYAIRYATGDQSAVAPSWTGWLIAVLVLVFLLWGAWGHMWTLGNTGIMIMIALIAVIFVLGIALRMMGLL